MDLTIRTTQYGNEDQSWLGSAHGTDMARPVTLDVSAFTRATHYPNGYFPSGLPLVRLGSGLYGPYTAPTGEDEPAELAGFLFTSLSTDGTTDTAGALLDHGRVVTSRLPAPVDDAGKATATGRIIFV